MATFRKIHVTFWSDNFIQTLTPEQRYFYIYLLTNDRTQQCGIYEITKRKIGFDTGYNLETVDKLLAIFIQMGKITYDNETNEIAILNWKKYNDSSSPKVKGCINKELLTVKSQDLILLMGYEAPIGGSFNKNYRVGTALRESIFKRDNYCCKKCKSIKNLQIDHIIPRAIGGKSIENNLRCLCNSCNSSRPIMGDDLINEIEADGLNFNELCRINGIEAYAYSIGRLSQKEKEKEKEEEEEEEKGLFGVVENQLSAYFPLEFAFSCWLKIFPNYPKDIKKDYPALRSIVEHISKKQPSQISKDELSDVILNFAKKVFQNSFYKDKSLSTISNKIQDILLSANNNNSSQTFKPQKAIFDSGFSHNDYLEYAKEKNL